jgi:hypothetical protein
VISTVLQDPEHPRAGLKPELKAWCQESHAECLAQLAVFTQGRQVLSQDPSVFEALEAVAAEGLSVEAQQHAKSALIALSDTGEIKTEDGQKHVMLSCELASCVLILKRMVLPRCLLTLRTC